jgi:hypothetical protein
MNAILRHTATLAIAFAATLPAADSRLVNLVMPGATVIAGVNVAQAKATPFGQYVLTLVAPHDPQIQALATLTGFDPRRDVTELLAATSGGAGATSGLALARGVFPTETVIAAATVAGAATESYQNFTILKSPDGLKGLAFLDSSLAVFGDVVNVKGAIDRQSPGARHLPAAVVAQIGQLSAANDAWVVTTVSPAGLRPPSMASTVPGLNAQALQQVQRATVAVKLGADVKLTAQAQLDTPQNATTLAGMLQLVANMAQMQAQKNPDAAALAKALLFSADGSTVSVTFSFPGEQLRKLTEPRQRGGHTAPQPAGHKSL